MNLQLNVRNVVNLFNYVKNMKKIYYIKCLVDEFHYEIQGFFETLEEAKETLKSCSNWCCPKNTGKIYSRELGLNGKIELIVDNWQF